jgi:hypothetical protein
VILNVFHLIQINYQEPEDNQTFLHALLESTRPSEEVCEGLEYLLEQGADITKKCKFKKGSDTDSQNEVLPVHIAVKMQYEKVGFKLNYDYFSV